MNLLWILLHAPKYSGECFFKFRLCRKVSIMGPREADMVPETFDRVELRGIRWEIVDSEPGSILLKPPPHVLILMIGSIILDEEGFAREIKTCQLLKEAKVGFGIKDAISVVTKLCLVKFNHAKDFDAFPLSGYRNGWLVSTTRPGLREG